MATRIVVCIGVCNAADVYFDGDIGATLAKADNTLTADFAAPKVARFHGQPWPNWHHLSGELSRKLPVRRRWASFFPITRYTPRMLMLLEDNLGKSSGFCEVGDRARAEYAGVVKAGVGRNLV